MLFGRDPDRYASAFLAMPGVVALWPLDEVAGNTYRDIGPNRLTMTKSATVLPTTLPGSIASGGLLGVAGAGVGAETPDIAAVDLGDNFGISAIIVRGATGTGRAILGKGTGAYYLRVNATGGLNLLRSRTTDMCNSTIVMAAGKTYHVVGTKGGATVWLFIDGANVTGALTNSTCVDNTNSLRMFKDISPTEENSGHRLAMVGLMNRLMTHGEAAHLAALALGR